MSPDISFTTVGLSATVSIGTGYIGTLINYGRQRNRSSRIFGLALLAEIKSLQRIFRRHYKLISAETAIGSIHMLPSMHVSSADLTVFNNGSGNLGLFSSRAAVEIIEFYSAVRHLINQMQVLAELRRRSDYDEAELRAALANHLWSMRIARRHSRVAVTALRREIPFTLTELIGQCTRRSRIRLKRMKLQLLR